MTVEDFRKDREQIISKDLETIENIIRRVFKKGCELGYQKRKRHDDKRYWDGYHAAQEDGKKIYQKGLEDAWNAARKIFLDNDHSLAYSELYVIFKTYDLSEILETFSAFEAVEKIREYEDRNLVT